MRRTIIGLAGAAGSGKDTLAAHLVRHHGFTALAFADPLRAMLAALLPYLGVHGDIARLMADRNWKEGPLPVIGRSPRHLMQTLGTEWGRERVDDAMWRLIMQQRIAITPGPIVITDVRFANEAALVHQLGGAVWQLKRRGAGTASSHVSESALPASAIDIVICNDGTLEQLAELADEELASLDPHHESSVT